MRSFRSVFIAVVIAVALIVAAFIINSLRPRVETQQPTAASVRASGKCAECHARETPAIVHEYEMSRHAARGVNCLDCHGPTESQQGYAHRGFTLARNLTSANCARCHAAEYRQFLRSRHAAPSWAAVRGPVDFKPEQIAFAEQYHPGAVNRASNAIGTLEGPVAQAGGCLQCHAVGRPNPDGSIGTCTNCHARHAASVALARLPETCGQCHMGPDHSQIEIYHESKHGVLFNAQRASMRLDAPANRLTTADMPVPTCATCHMSGLEGQAVTHDTSERLSWYLFAEISTKRPNYVQAQTNMKEICLKCHTKEKIDPFYQQAEVQIASTNQIVAQAKAIMDRLHATGKLTPKPFDEELEYTYFNMWHYDGRTSKHGAFMGGADFVQWHGNYELVSKLTEIRNGAAALGLAPAK
ncbi:MAG TPA: multiheme c-type cytochrome [Thermoanaerobaculia bacterium]|nr:multiheme c-type cytochrome [Thermoanaerobaculia bacterium]